MLVHLYSSNALFFYHYNLSLLNFMHILHELNNFYRCEHDSSSNEESSPEITSVQLCLFYFVFLNGYVLLCHLVLRLIFAANQRWRESCMYKKHDFLNIIFFSICIDFTRN